LGEYKKMENGKLKVKNEKLKMSIANPTI